MLSCSGQADYLKIDHYTNMFSSPHSPQLSAITQTLWTDSHPADVTSQDYWRLASVVNSSLADYPTIQQPGFELPRRYWTNKPLSV